MRDLEVGDRLREAERSADAQEVGERIAVAVDRARRLAFGLDRAEVGGDQLVDLGHAAPSLSFSVDGHDSLCAAAKASV